jgi:nucleoid DNA-binding protein
MRKSTPPCRAQLRLWLNALRLACADMFNPQGDRPMELAVESIDSPALTKAQLADLLFDEIGLNKREAKDMVDAFFDLISQKLVEGEDVKLSGFGNFQIRTKAPRPVATRAPAS